MSSGEITCRQSTQSRTHDTYYSLIYAFNMYIFNVILLFYIGVATHIHLTFSLFCKILEKLWGRRSEKPASSEKAPKKIASRDLQHTYSDSAGWRCNNSTVQRLRLSSVSERDKAWWCCIINCCSLSLIELRRSDWPKRICFQSICPAHVKKTRQNSQNQVMSPVPLRTGEVP